MIGRLGRLAAFMVVPSNFWLMARAVGWACVLPALKRTVPLPVLARLLWRRSHGVHRHPTHAGRIEKVARWIYGPSALSAPRNCLERSLLLYRLLSKHHDDAQIVTGVRRGEGQWQGHAWVLVDGRPFGEPAANVEDFTPLFIVGPNGVVRAEARDNAKG